MARITFYRQYAQVSVTCTKEDVVATIASYRKHGFDSYEVQYVQ
jgi:hypothetical protein